MLFLRAGSLWLAFFKRRTTQGESQLVLHYALTEEVFTYIQVVQSLTLGVGFVEVMRCHSYVAALHMLQKLPQYLGSLELVPWPSLTAQVSRARWLRKCPKIV